jgi:hypothetical protein
MLVTPMDTQRLLGCLHRVSELCDIAIGAVSVGEIDNAWENLSAARLVLAAATNLLEVYR